MGVATKIGHVTSLSDHTYPFSICDCRYYWGPKLASRQNREARFDFLIFDFWFSNFWQPYVPAPLFLGYALLLL
jgi:hypothetical protein